MSNFLKINPVFDEIIFQFFEFITWNPMNRLKQYLMKAKVFFIIKTANKFEDLNRCWLEFLQDSAWLFCSHLENTYRQYFKCQNCSKLLMILVFKGRKKIKFPEFFGNSDRQIIKTKLHWSIMIQMTDRKIKAILPIQSFFLWNCWGHQQLIVTCNIITTVTFASKCTQSSPNANSTSAKFH